MENMQSSKQFDRSRHHRLDLLFRTYVDMNWGCCATLRGDCCCRCLRRLLQDVGDDNGDTFKCKAFGRCLSNSAATSCNDRNFILKTHIRHTLKGTYTYPEGMQSRTRSCSDTPDSV